MARLSGQTSTAYRSASAKAVHSFCRTTAAAAAASGFCCMTFDWIPRQTRVTSPKPQTTFCFGSTGILLYCRASSTCERIYGIYFYISQQIRICSAPSPVSAAYYHMRSHTVNGYLTYIYDSTANRELLRCTRCVCCILLRALSCCTAVLLLLGVCGVMISRCFRCLPFAVRSTDLTKPRQIVRCTVQDAHFIRMYQMYAYGISIRV